jgi:KDO2-lipid IV(A) lauroyltransferase
MSCAKPPIDTTGETSEARLGSEPPAAPPSWSDRAEAGGAALFFAAMRALPIDAASALGGALARLIGPRLGISARARRNLAAALPELSAAEIERVIRGMWDNLGRVAAEYPHLRRVRVFPPDGRVETSGVEHLDRAIAAGRPVIIFGGHLGNWEIAALAAGQYGQDRGIDVAQIYRAANNKLVDRMIARFRGTASEFIPKGRVASRRALAALRRGAHLTLLVDQKLNDGIPIRFFGREAMTAPALALLALHFDCAVLPARVERLEGAHFRLTIYPPLPLPKSAERAADVAALMAAVNGTLESWIRERPEQWFWLHRRWPDWPSSHQRWAAGRADQPGAAEDGEDEEAGDEGEPGSGRRERPGAGPADRGQRLGKGGEARGDLTAPEEAAPRLGAKPELDRRRGTRRDGDA